VTCLIATQPTKSAKKFDIVLLALLLSEHKEFTFFGKFLHNKLFLEE